MGAAEPQAGGGTPLADLLAGEAREAYLRGRDAFEQQQYAVALESFERALTLSREPRLYWNMAACQRSLSRFARAKALMNRFIAAAKQGANVPPGDVARAHEFVSAVNAKVAPLEIQIAPEGSELLVDGERVEVLRGEQSVDVDAGRHVIEARKVGFRPWVVVREATAQQPLVVSHRLEPAVANLTIRTSAANTIVIDAKTVGHGDFQANLTPGRHAVEIRGDRESDLREIYLEDRENRVLEIWPERAVNRPWLWASLGCLLGLFAGAAAWEAVDRD